MPSRRRAGAGDVGARPRATPRSPRARRGAASRPSRCRAGSRSRRPSRRCRPRAASPRRAPAARRPPARAGTDDTNDDRADVRAAEDRPGERVPEGALPSAPRRPARTSAPTPRAAPRTRRSPMPRDAHLLAGRRRRGRREQVPRQPVRRRRRAPRRRARRPAATSRCSTVGSAKTREQRRAPGGSTPAARSSTPSRRIQPQVENSDMYMWSSTNTWSRSTESRSRYSGRSWCAIVATDACSRATCDSSAIVTWSRKRRCTRVLTDRAGTTWRSPRRRGRAPQPTTSRRSRASTPSASSLSQSAQERVGQRREQRQRERGHHQPRLVPVAELQRRHIEDERGRQVGQARGQS